jgi:hypothetical protein
MSAENNEEWAPYLEKRAAWVKALKAGKNPFTPAVLEELRAE